VSGGRAPARKGARIERELVHLLCELGLPCSRVPLSGAIGGAWSGDIDLELFERTAKIQVKARREFRTLHQWLRSNELLILKADRQDPLVVMPVHLFAELATAAQKVRP
jgi:Holliday junction resolvase